MILPTAIWASLRLLKNDLFEDRLNIHSPLYNVYLLKTTFGTTNNDSFVRTPKRSWKIRENALLKKKKKSTTPFNSSRKRISLRSLNYLEPEIYIWTSVPGKGLYLQNLNNHTIISQMWRLYAVIFSLSKWPMEHPGIVNLYVRFLNTQNLTSLGRRYKLFLLCVERNTTETIFWHLTHQMLECAMRVKKKLTYETILIWLRVLKCHNISGYNIHSGLWLYWYLSNLFWLGFLTSWYCRHDS